LTMEFTDSVAPGPNDHGRRPMQAWKFARGEGLSCHRMKW
jgi:hypothetical protein